MALKVELRDLPDEAIQGSQTLVRSEVELRDVLLSSNCSTALVRDDDDRLVGLYRQHEPGCWRNAL